MVPNSERVIETIHSVETLLLRYQKHYYGHPYAETLMTSVFFFFGGGTKGIVFIEYFQRGHTITGEHDVNLLRQLQKLIKKKCPGRERERGS